jgi:hypothetical protein
MASNLRCDAILTRAARLDVGVSPLSEEAKRP